LWQNEDIVSISLSGAISILDINNNERPRHVQLGHNRLINSVTYNPKTNKLYTVDPTAYMIEWDYHNGHTTGFKGNPHTGPVGQVKVIGDHLVSISTDDTVKITPLHSLEYGEGIALGSQPNGVDGHDNVIVISAHDSLIVMNHTEIVNKLSVKFEPSCITLSPDKTHVAAGSKTDQLIHVFHLDGGKLSEKYVIEGHRGEVSALAYSPCGRYLAAGDGNREVKVFQEQKCISSGWVFHTSKIMSVSWSSDSSHVATGSVDSAVIVWDVNDNNKRIHLKMAHLGGVRGVVFVDGITVVSVGEDCCMKSWSLSFT